MDKPFNPYPDEPQAEKITGEEVTAWATFVASVVAFIKKNKNTIYGIILLIVGALGGNLDRVGDAFKDADAGVSDTQVEIEHIKAQVYSLNERVLLLEERGITDIEPEIPPEPEPYPDIRPEAPVPRGEGKIYPE